MGKQSRLKRERKSRREQQRPQLEEWSKIPDNAQSGPCRKPDCGLVHCLDPWITELELHNKSYNGKLILMTYSIYPTNAVDIEVHMRINGEEIGILPSGDLFRSNPAAHESIMQRLLEKAGDRFGAGVGMAIVQHVSASPQILEKQRKDSRQYEPN